ncbi:DUF3298 and DUF4163 domain-containing protein [Cohnella candidum]|uniref:DUF3298/DUF4163 domain-containing protein n=1 Tax=Cohnella candidum TaxID=2674991 RepID=A0A3G3K3V0_9BACL|nr:DUF3298 and DUF4163 domain-containing protein [Cohnella candidum]AYQ75060.1 DUF3298/DUF4163 domain-containing protein [Cohnella candidum]
MNRTTLMLPITVRTFTAPRNVKVSIPAVAGGTVPSARDSMNRDIVRTINAQMQSQGYPGGDIREMLGFFEVKTNQRGVLSLCLLNYTYTGGAHGNTLQHSLTFDADTGRKYSLRELFKPGSPYEKRLNDIVQAQIATRKLPLLGPYPGLSPDQDYYIADKALVIYFPLYALVPYAWGFPYFPISVYDIQDLIDENGPLGAMLY